MAKKINVKLKKGKPSNIPNLSNHKDMWFTVLQGKLQEDLDAVEDPDSEDESKNRTEAKFKPYRGQKKDRKVSSEELTAVNYTEDSWSEDDILFFILINGEWLPLSGSGGGMKIAILKAGDKITKRSGSNPGKGEVTLEKFSDDKINATEKTVEVYNNFESEITTDGGDEENEEKDTYIQISKMNGKWWVTAVDCADNREDE